jgi:hypothetical protein
MKKNIAIVIAGLIAGLAYTLAPKPSYADFIPEQGYEEFCLSGWVPTIWVAPDFSHIRYEFTCGDLGGYGEGGTAPLTYGP